MTGALTTPVPANSLAPLIGSGRSVLLHRINPELNQFRFYHVRIGPTLLDQHAVIRVWGRIGGHQRTMINPCQTDVEARTLADRLIRQRLKRGYTLVQNEMSRGQIGRADNGGVN